MRVLKMTENSLAGMFLAFFLILAYVSIFLASKPLTDPLVNESVKISALGLKPSLATEYRPDGSLFWWITDEGMELSYTNNSNETVVGNLKIFLSGNPCELRNIVQLKKAEQYLFDTVVTDQRVITSEVAIALEPFENLVISLNSIAGETCKIDNGDTRIFMAKIDGWVFE
jgi:hypothetical protein